MFKRLLFVNMAFILFSVILATNVYAFKLPDTGQALCNDSSGNVIGCAGAGQDGDI